MYNVFSIQHGCNYNPQQKLKADRPHPHDYPHMATDDLLWHRYVTDIAPNSHDRYN